MRILSQALCQAHGPPWVPKRLSYLQTHHHTQYKMLQGHVEGGIGFRGGAQSRNHYFLSRGGALKESGELPTAWRCLGTKSGDMELLHTPLDPLARSGSWWSRAVCLPGLMGISVWGMDPVLQAPRRWSGQQGPPFPQWELRYPSESMATPLTQPCPGNPQQRFFFH